MGSSRHSIESKLRYIGAPIDDPRGYFPLKDGYIVPLESTCLHQPRFPHGTATQAYVSVNLRGRSGNDQSSRKVTQPSLIEWLRM